MNNKVNKKKEPVRKDMPVTMGYHNLRVKPGESIQVEKDGKIILVGSRGKRTDTGKNINTKPVEFRGPPLQGDVQNIKYYSGPYHEQKAEDHPMFSIWQGLNALTGGKIKFSKYNAGKTKGLFRAIIGEYQLIAKEAHPIELLYIKDSDGRLHCKTGLRAQIPVTVDYVKACEREYRLQLRDEKLKREAELEAIKQAEELKHRSHKKKKGTRFTHLAEPNPNEVVHISKETTLKAMGLMPPEAHLEEYNTELRDKKFTKQELTDLAKISWAKLQTERQAK
jgi:hypothetical protein